MYRPNTLKQQARQARLMRNAQCLRGIQYGIYSQLPGRLSDLDEVQPQSRLEKIFIDRRVEHLNRARQYRKVENLRQSQLSTAPPV